MNNKYLYLKDSQLKVNQSLKYPLVIYNEELDDVIYLDNILDKEETTVYTGAYNRYGATDFTTGFNGSSTPRSTIKYGQTQTLEFTCHSNPNLGNWNTFAINLSNATDTHICFMRADNWIIEDNIRDKTSTRTTTVTNWDQWRKDMNGAKCKLKVINTKDTVHVEINIDGSQGNKYTQTYMVNVKDYYVGKDGWIKDMNIRITVDQSYITIP